MPQEILTTNCWECWWIAFLIEITVAVIVHISASIIRWSWYHFGGKKESHPQPLILDWSEIMVFVVYLVVQAGIVMSSLGVIRQWSGLAIVEWPWQTVVVAWTIYFVASVLTGWLALNFLSAHKRERNLKNAARRSSIFFVSIFAKLGVFLFASGWVMSNPSANFSAIIPISFFIAIGFDAIAFIFIMLVD